MLVSVGHVHEMHGEGVGHIDELFNRSAHSAGPEFRIWSSELGIASARDCPQTLHMLQASARFPVKKSLEFLKFLEPDANSPYKSKLISRIFDFSQCILSQVD